MESDCGGTFVGDAYLSGGRRCGMETDRILTGDSMEVLQDLPTESVHACVTDPPYGLAFMGRSWDDFEPKEYQEFCENWARRVKRVLKPGAHLLAFSGNRTHHRLFTGVEDAGFEIRDTLTWHYGSGFPKATDIGKTIDKRADAEREVVGEQRGNGIEPGHGNYVNNERSTWNGDGFDKTAPATDAAKRWDGWKTGLKPATEYVVMARKPFDGATVDCVQEHGTGALNIDGCRVGLSDGETKAEFDRVDIDQQDKQKYGTYEKDGTRYAGESTEGRYPSNVVFDEVEAERLDREVGEMEGGNAGAEYEHNGGTNYDITTGGASGYEDYGGPSRYFYTSKASKSERTENGQIKNSHPTVKPTDLMEWLVKLVTREGQVVIDPFAGSGTTCKAAKALGREFVGIERQAKWADVARVRCGLTPNDPAVVRGDDNQQGLESY